MNVKQGELARVVSNSETDLIGISGLIFMVKVPVNLASGEPGWSLPEPRLCRCGCGEYLNAVPDENCRPIRDPGEDAVDETLTWKPLPLPEIVPAMLDREVEHG